MTEIIVCADAYSYLRSLSDRSVHCVITSPPYFGQRRYLPPSHPNANLEIGIEDTLADYIDDLTAVFMEAHRVLRDDGLLFIVIGDSYVTSPRGNKAAGGGKLTNSNIQSSVEDARWLGGKAKNKRKATSLPQKSLMGVPWRLALALMDRGFILRNEIIWSKATFVPEAVKDRFTRSHETIFMFSKTQKYYFDRLTVAELIAGSGFITKNRRTVWNVTSKPTSDPHYAAFSSNLVELMVKAGASPKVCSHCGKPYRILTSKDFVLDPTRPQAQRAATIYQHSTLTEAHIHALRACGLSDTGKARVMTSGTGKNDPEIQRLADEARAVLKGYAREFLTVREQITDRVPACNCGYPPEPGLIVDPFMGSGTTLKVALSLHRRATGCDLNQNYVDMANRNANQPFETTPLPLPAHNLHDLPFFSAGEPS